MDLIDDLALFIRVVDAGGMSAAARAGHHSTQFVSQRLQRLEARLGLRLLHRTTRQVQLTEAGERFLARARALVEDAEALVADMGAEGGAIAGTLRLTLPASFGHRHVAPLLPTFLAAHPQLRLALLFSDQLVDLVAGGLDLGIRIGTLADSTLASRRLAPNRRLLCASPAYLARAGTPQRPEALAAHDCLVLVDGSERQDLWRLYGPGGAECRVRVSGRVEANHGGALREAALGGLGIALKSTWDVADDLVAGRLVPVLADWQPEPTAIWAVFPQRRHLPPRVSACIDFLATRFGPQPPWEQVLAGAGATAGAAGAAGAAATETAAVRHRPA